MHTELVHKHDTADSKTDVFKTSSNMYVQWNEKYTLLLFIKCFNSLNYTQFYLLLTN